MARWRRVDADVIDGYFTDTADKIREKTGSEGTYTPKDMPSGVEDVYEAGISVGILKERITKTINDLSPTASSENRMTWVQSRTKSDLPLTKDIANYKPYQSDNTKRYAVGVNSELVKSIIENSSIYQEIDVGVDLVDKNNGSNVLVPIGGYFKLSHPITLKSNKPWRVELKGRIPNGISFLYNSKNLDYIRLIDGNSNFIEYYKGALEIAKKIPYDSPTFDNVYLWEIFKATDVIKEAVERLQVNDVPIMQTFPKPEGVPSNIRFGQNAVDGIFILENVYNEINDKWELWVDVNSSKGVGRWCYGKTIDDLTVNQFGSDSSPFTVNDCAGNKYVTYFDYIKIREEELGSTYEWDFSQATISNDTIATTNDLTTVFSREEVESVFTAEEWSALIATKSNWSISLK